MHQDHHPMSRQCWSTGCNAVPILHRRWVKISSHLPHPTDTRYRLDAGRMLVNRLWRWSSFKTTLGKRLVPARRLPNVVLMLGQRLWRWPNIHPTMAVRLDCCLLVHKSDHPTNTACWHSAGLMLAHRVQRWASISPALCHVLWSGSQVYSVSQQTQHIHPMFA